MLNWLRKRIIDNQRRLFVFWDGQKSVRVDPMVIFRRMGEHPDFDPKNDFERLRHPDTPKRLEANGHLAGIVRDLFDLPVFDGAAGLTEQELLAVLYRFNAEMAAVKKNTNPPRESSQSMESPVQSDSPLPSSTSDSSGSGLTPQTA